MRAAFGRYGGHPKAREAAVAVVRRCQQQGAGHWFVCDCRPDAPRPPVLVPVSQTHIRRHQDAGWSAHCESCDFYREPAEQREVTASYSKAAAERPLRLARSLSEAPAAMHRRIEANSRNTRRPGLARLLMRLLTDAGLQAIAPGWRPPPLVDQIKAVWGVARSIEIDSNVLLPEFLCTSPVKLPELVERVAAADPARFVRNRPHGVLLARVGAIGDGMLEPLSGEPIPVMGRVAVFGERAGDGRETREARTARASYLAICVLGRPSPEAPVAVLSAYAHPIAGATHLMLVDSDLERHTLSQLRSVQGWLGRRKDLAVRIDKPLFDVAPDGEPEANSRPPVIPDYVLEIGRAGDCGEVSPAAIVETMGFADAAYRERKRRTHPLMRSALGDVPLLTHDFHEPAGQAQAERDALLAGRALVADRPRSRSGGGDFTRQGRRTDQCRRAASVGLSSSNRQPP